MWRFVVFGEESSGGHGRGLALRFVFSGFLFVRLERLFVTFFSSRLSGC